MIWYSCVASGTSKYTTTCKHWMIGTEASNLQTSRPSKSLTPPHLGVTKGQPAHFSDLAPCNPHQSNAPNGSSCWICFIPMTHLLLKKHPSDSLKTSHEGFWQVAIFQSICSAKFGPIISLPSLWQRTCFGNRATCPPFAIAKQPTGPFFREPVSPWQLSGVVPIIYLESCILPPPHSVNSDKGFFQRDSLS